MHKAIRFLENFSTLLSSKIKENISVKIYKLQSFIRMNKISNKFKSTFLRGYFQS